jgi:dihydropteroate synthase
VVIKTCSKDFELKCGRFSLKLGPKTLIMGILNITPDSFYDGGFYNNPDKAVYHAEKMAEEGADIIDVGGESTRPGSQPVNAREELSRVLPVIRELVKRLQIPVSVDTYKAEVAKRVLEEGADIINDISGFSFDPGLVEILSSYDHVPVIVMHTYDKPRTMQNNPVYSSLIEEIKNSLEKSMQIGIEGGIQKDRFIIDPGIGFGKTVSGNLEIIRRLSEFKMLGRPVLIGTSRKSFIRKILDLPAEASLEGSLATVASCIMNGADIVRVHDVKETKRVSMITDAIKRGREEKNGL